MTSRLAQSGAERCGKRHSTMRTSNCMNFGNREVNNYVNFKYWFT